MVGVGCGRSGSTWWWSLLLQHPQVVPSRLAPKELHYFQHFGWDGPDHEAIALYREAFAAPPGAVSGDGSFNYLTHPLALGHLWTAAPESRLIVLVRNPVDRFISTRDQLARVRLPWLGLTDDRAYVQETFSFWCEAFTHCRLADGIAVVQAHWDPARVLVLQFEQCIVDPAREYVRTCRFLGLDEGFVPTGLTRPVNQRPHRLAPPDAAARRRIADALARDVDATLAAWPTIDRRLWRDFA